MSKKSNISTLRKSNKNFNFLNEHSNKSTFLLTFMNLINRLLTLKNVSLIKANSNFVNNQFFVHLFVYFKYTKTAFYKKRAFVSAKNVPSTSLYYSFLKSLSYLFKTNLVILKFTTLNTSINPKLLSSLYKKIKFVKKTLFARRYFMFIDFICQSTLFIQGLIPAKKFLILLGDIFKTLPKSRHKLFLTFLKRFFTLLLELSKNFEKLDKSNLKGFKFIIGGKLQGKLRSSSATVQIGEVPIQSIDKNIEYSKIHVYTLYGVFGMKL